MPPDAGTGAAAGRVVFDLAALRANHRELVRRCRPGVRIIGSVKANAYGHGVVPVARTLAAEGVGLLATGSLEEAIAVRASGVATGLLLLGTYLPAAMPEILAHGVVPTVWTLELARAASRAATTATGVYVKVDAGFGRLGVPLAELASFVAAVAALPRVRIDGLYTHLPFVDDDGRAWALERVDAFRRGVAALERAGHVIGTTQASSSAGALAGIDDGCSAVCPGHILYGIPPAAEELVSTSGFRPVLTSVETHLVQVTAHPAARRAGLGGRLSLPAGTTTGVVPIGRAHGLRPARHGIASMLVHGRRAPVIGLSLEHATLDLTGIPAVEPGVSVIALGRSGDERITVDELAGWQGASIDEVILTLDGRLPATYLDGP